MNGSMMKPMIEKIVSMPPMTRTTSETPTLGSSSAFAIDTGGSCSRWNCHTSDAHAARLPETHLTLHPEVLMMDTTHSIPICTDQRQAAPQASCLAKRPSQTSQSGLTFSEGATP